MSVKGNLIQSIVAPSISDQGTYKTIGMVDGADEKKNTCRVNFINKQGRISNKDNVPIQLQGGNTDWIPKKGDTVVLEVNKDTIVVIAPYVDNYAADVRANLELKEDVYSDGSGAQSPGGSIM